MIRFYLMPIVGVGTNADPRTCKYRSELGRWMGMDYGPEPVMLVRAEMTAQQDAIVTAHADVLSVPEAMTETVGPALAAAQAKLEAVNIPANWITGDMQWRDVVRGIASIFQLAQRMHGQGLSQLFSAGVTLDSTFGSLSANVRTRLAAMADSFGFDRSGVTAGTTLRQALRGLANQWAGQIVCGDDRL